MAEVVNLRAARKRRRRAEAAAEAAENRIRHGRSREERSEAKLLTTMAERKLEGHRREPAGGRGPDPRKA